jgi:copper transport protein
MLASARATPALAARPAVPYHATLISSEPAKGSTIASSPARIYLVFSEEVEASLGSIRLVGPAGRVVALKSTGDPRNVSALVGPLTTPLDNGSWRVEWRIVSEDGHPIDGSFTFTVAGASVDTAASVAVPPSAVEPPHDSAHPVEIAPTSEEAAEQSAFSDVPVLAATLRGLGVGLLTAFAGLLWFLGTRRDRARQPRADRLASSLAIATAVSLVLHFLVWTLAVSPDRSLSGEQMGVVMSSRVGRLEVMRAAFAVLACWAFVLARRDKLTLAFAVAAMSVSAATGHSAAIHPSMTIPMRALHLLAIAAWLGGLLWLLALERPTIAAVAAESQRVSSAALLAVIVVAISGIVQTKYFIGEWGELLRSTYGAVVILKLAGLGVLVLFGAHHRYRVLPRLADAGVSDGLTRSLRTEVLVMSLVIMIGGLLAYIPPPQH